MKSTEDFVKLLREYKAQSASKYGIEEIGIFGSVARGEHHEGSDVDVYVKMIHPNLFLLSGIKQDLEAVFGCPVDVIRKRDSLKPLLKRNIERDCVYA